MAPATNLISSRAKERDFDRDWIDSSGRPYDEYILRNDAAPQLNEQCIRDAIDQANMNALRMALYQVTGDPELAAMHVRNKAICGGALYDYLLAEENPATLEPTPLPPSREDARRMIETFGAEPVIDVDFGFGFGYVELACEELPRDISWTNKPSAERLAAFKVVVIGAAISGIAASIQLKRLGIPFSAIERQSGIDGTWLRNTYPEARVDTSSYLYGLAKLGARMFATGRSVFNARSTLCGFVAGPEGGRLPIFRPRGAADFVIRDEFVARRTVARPSPAKTRDGGQS